MCLILYVDEVSSKCGFNIQDFKNFNIIYFVFNLASKSRTFFIAPLCFESEKVSNFVSYSLPTYI